MIAHNRKKQSLRISAKGNSSMQSPQTQHGAVTIQSIILFSFRRYESIHIAKDLILLYCAFRYTSGPAGLVGETAAHISRLRFRKLHKGGIAGTGAVYKLYAA